MKDEIKEKIRQWYIDDDLISILNYITNLQEQYSELRDDLDGIIEGNIRLQEENKVLKELNVCVGCDNNSDYKSIIDKAIEYNYELQERYCHSALFDDLVASKIYEITEKQLNILKGEDK